MSKDELVILSNVRLHAVRICFKPYREWQESINAAGPNTPNDCDVRKVGDQYPSMNTEEIREDLILLNFPNGGGSFNNALNWAQSQRLQSTVPQEVFAIGEQYPGLHEELEQDLMFVSSTKICSAFGERFACCIRWNGSGRLTCLNSLGYFDTSHDWFAFRDPVQRI